MLKRANLVVSVLLLFATAGWVQAAPAGKLAVSFPGAGTYTYWIQAKSGAVSVLPTTVNKKTVTVAKPVAAGDTLNVLDAHTGQVASHTVTADGTGAPAAITLSVSDFHPLTASVLRPPPAAPAAPVNAAATTAPNAAGGVGRLLTFLLSLIVAGGVIWVILTLIRTRGEPLIALARRAGVPVPDPTPFDSEPEAAPVYTPPAPRPVEKIPEEAGALPPLSQPRVQRGPAIGLSEVPQLVGTQGLAAGSTFSLTAAEVTIGRDGDNGIVLAENTVSRHHARVMREGPGQFTILDEGSANGIYVNGTRVQRAVLAAGDEIKIGDNFFRYEA